MAKKIPLLAYVITTFLWLLFFQEAVALEYVNNNSCLSCHKKQALEWKISDHYHSMLPASKSSVTADFDNKFFHFDQVTTRFYTKKNHYFIQECIETSCKTYQVAFTFGYKPLQQYLVKFPNGALQAYPVAWDNTKKKFFHLQNKKNRKAQSPLHWQKRFYTWNHACADCHSTGFKKNYIAGQYRSQFTGVNVNCQACHGPGANHIKWTKNKLIPDKGFIINHKNMSRQSMMLQCAQCHSHRAPLNNGFDAGKKFHQQYRLSVLKPNLYYPDGQMKEEVFVYGSFLQSTMHQRGVTCVDCHNPHTTKLKLNGNRLCLQCHSNSGNPRFKTLTKNNYTSSKHHHHKVGSTGSLCVNCHMPQTTYMGIDKRADHQFSIPNPDNTIRHKIPNACNRCHEDKSPQWSKKWLLKWYGKLHQKTLLTSNQNLLKILNDKNSPDIYKATALFLLPINHRASYVELQKSLQSNSFLLKRTALEKLELIPIKYSKSLIVPFLKSNTQTLKAQAGFLLAGESGTDKQAIRAYRKQQLAHLDLSQSYFNLALLSVKEKMSDKAIKLLNTAIKKDPHAINAYLLLSQLYSSSDKIRELLLQGIIHNPTAHLLHYQLGLNYTEQKQYQHAAMSLEKAYRLNPLFAKAAYNLALVYLKLGKISKAKKQVQRAIEINPTSHKLRELMDYMKTL